MKKRQVRGFTLIELMITVAIVGILGALAYPAYTSSVIKGKRAQARTALTELMQQQERYMTQRNCYLGFSNPSGTPGSFSACGGVTPTFTTFPFKTYSGDNPNSAAYLLSASTCSATIPITECVRLTAQPRMPDPEVGNLMLSSVGEKTCSGTKADANGKSPVCWP